MNVDLAADKPPLISPDETPVGIADGMQGPVEFVMPEIKKLPHDRKFRRYIIVLPDESLQDGDQNRECDKEYELLSGRNRQAGAPIAMNTACFISIA